MDRTLRLAGVAYPEARVSARVDLSEYPHLGDWEDWERPELEAAVRAAEHKRALAQLQEGAAADQAEREQAKRAPAERRRRERAALQRTRAAAREHTTAELAELRLSPPRSGRGRPSLIDSPEARVLFQRADAAGLTAPELAAVFGVSERTVRAWRLQP